MTRARVLVIEHQATAGLGQLTAPIAATGAEIVTVGPDTGLPVPDALDAVDALIVLGGNMGPEDDAAAPWLPGTRRLLADAVAAEVPTLGVCLGAQLLAVANGGTVRPMGSDPEIGVQTVRFGDVDEDPLFGPLEGRTVPAMQWHYLEASELPEGSRVLASNDACPHQAFAFGAAAWGVQFHPEALTEIAADWTAEDPEGLEIIGATPLEVLDAVRDAEPELRRVWTGLAERFGRIAVESARRRENAA